MKTPPPENETADQRMVRIMDDDFTIFDFTKVNHDVSNIPSSEPHVDLCEKADYKAAVESEPKATVAA